MSESATRLPEGPSRSLRRVAAVVGLAALCLGWSSDTIRQVAWSSVEFFPDDLRRQVLRHHRRFDAGIERGLAAPPSWRAASPGSLGEALEAQLDHCAQCLRQPVPLDDLVEEMGVLAVRVLDAADPLAASHADPREPRYAAAYSAYVDSVRDRLRLVYYGQDAKLINRLDRAGSVAGVLERSRSLYPYLGEEFYRTGSLRDWRSLDDRSVAFGVTAISLSRGLTDLANFASYVWRLGGGRIPTPRPTPAGHVGPTVTLTLQGGFPGRDRPANGAPVMPRSSLALPSP